MNQNTGDSVSQRKSFCGYGWEAAQWGSGQWLWRLVTVARFARGNILAWPPMLGLGSVQNFLLATFLMQRSKLSGIHIHIWGSFTLADKVTNCSWIVEQLSSFEQFLTMYGSMSSIHLLSLQLFFWSFLINKRMCSNEQFQLCFTLPSLYYVPRDYLKVRWGTLHNKASLKGLKCGKSFSLALSNLEQQRWATKMFLLLAAGQIY